MTIPAIPSSALPRLRRIEAEHGVWPAFAERLAIARAAHPGPPAPDRAACEATALAAERLLLGPRAPRRAGIFPL